MTQQFIEGDVLDPQLQEIDRLHGEIRNLQRQLADARTEAARAREDAERALGMLRRQLSPLYRALQAVFGELDAAGIADEPTAVAGSAAAVPGDTREARIWEAWKDRLGSQCGKIIDALRLHAEMNTTQLAIAIGTRRQNIPNLIYKLNQAGLITKNGGRFSLKGLA